LYVAVAPHYDEGVKTEKPRFAAFLFKYLSNFSSSRLSELKINN
jgi:hypothetical protein